MSNGCDNKGFNTDAEIIPLDYTNSKTSTKSSESPADRLYQENNTKKDATRISVSEDSDRPFSGRASSLADIALYANKLQSRKQGGDGKKTRGWDIVREFVHGMRVMKRSTLVYTHKQKMRTKDFSKERRAGQDIKNLLHEAEIFLDLHETNLCGIVKNMVNQMLPENSGVAVSDCLRKLFADPICTMPTDVIQGSVVHGGNTYWEETWLCMFSSFSNLERHSYAISRLKHPVNLGPGASEIQFVILVLAPTREKMTKSAKETSLTFATLFSDLQFRWDLHEAKSVKQFKMIIDERYSDLVDHKTIRNVLIRHESMEGRDTSPFLEADPGPGCGIARGIRGDIKRRLPHYVSDYIDGFRNWTEISKLITTVIFLYFSCLLVTIAIGALNDKNTQGAFGVKESMVSLAIAGLTFALIGGQCMTILLTSAPLAIYAKLISDISIENGYDFLCFYACVGWFSCGLVFIYALFDLCKYMKYSTRMVDEVFALFISASFLKDAIMDTVYNFEENYNCLWDGTLDEPCTIYNATPGSVRNGEHNFTSLPIDCPECKPVESILFLFMVIAVPTLGLFLHYFRNSPFLGKTVRVAILADQALAITVIWWSFVHSYFFRHLEVEPWSYTESSVFRVPDFSISNMDGMAILLAAILGLFHSLLIFVDHSIAESVACAPENKLKKGTAFHWDLVVVVMLNSVSSLCGWPMVHGKLPHTPMHVRNLADSEERVVQGYIVTTIVKTTETRQSTLISHIFIALSLLMLPYPLQYIPQSVLDGIYTAYPPNHYVRRVPQRSMHFFTFLEMCCLVVVCMFGLAYETAVKLWFPFILLMLIPLRQLVFPKIIKPEYLLDLDQH
uniref:Sodium bicarbonate transporter-like protein 11-like n=1 Tax=Saccoglossus kowalevskii TaxID=10224 RepID=A0ABM0MHR3_SACKO|nr:PREDICTED: sodium bicarbonate transporter-like protein 11-like [Saccoglossus kowalevskii]